MIYVCFNKVLSSDGNDAFAGKDFIMPPKYMIIANQLRAEIQAGVYRHNQMLPTEREIMERFSVSRQTVRQALSILVQDGIIVKRQGSGSHIQSPHAAKKARSIAVVTTYIDDYIFPDILRDVEATLARHNYATYISSTENMVGREREVLQDVLSRQVDGLLIEGTKTALPNPNMDLYRRIQEQGIPIVFIHGAPMAMKNAILVADDNQGGGYQLTRYLIEKGHRKIGGIFKSDDVQGQLRYYGYTCALRDAGIPLPDGCTLWYSTELRDLMLLGDETMLTFYIDCLLKGCTAVVCYNDEVASRLVSIMHKKGLRVPEDMAVASFDNSHFSELSPVRITSLAHGSKKMGRTAAERLIALMEGRNTVGESVPWVLVEKDST